MGGKALQKDCLKLEDHDHPTDGESGCDCTKCECDTCEPCLKKREHVCVKQCDLCDPKDAVNANLADKPLSFEFASRFGIGAKCQHKSTTLKECDCCHMDFSE